jgi:hypothetical protein
LAPMREIAVCQAEKAKAAEKTAEKATTAQAHMPTLPHSRPVGYGEESSKTISPPKSREQVGFREKGELPLPDQYERCPIIRM